MECALSIYFASLTCVPIIRNEEDSTKYSKDDYIKSSSNFVHILKTLTYHKNNTVFNQ